MSQPESRTGLRAHRAFLQLRREEGQTLIEFGLALPFMLLIALGIFFFGLAMNNYMTLNDAVSVGTRVLTTSRGLQSWDPCAQAGTAIMNAAPNLTASNIKLSFSIVDNSGNSLYSSSSPVAPGAATCSSVESSLVEYGYGQIQATYPCTLSFFTFNTFSNCQLTAKITDIMQ